MTAKSSGFVWDETWEAAENLSTKQFYFVKDNGSGKATSITGITDVPIGVLMNDPDAEGQPAVIRRLGRGPISADTSLNIGDFVGPSSDGQADARVIGTDTTHYVGGRVREAAGATGDIVSCDINCVAPGRAA